MPETTDRPTQGEGDSKVALPFVMAYAGNRETANLMRANGGIIDIYNVSEHEVVVSLVVPIEKLRLSDRYAIGFRIF